MYLGEASSGAVYSRNQLVIIPGKYGKDLGRVLGPVGSTSGFGKEEIVPLVRLATERDIENYKENEVREKEALEICKEKVAARGLSMKLVSAHYLTEEKKVLFFFTAESRVDFRELVKDLVSVFKMRIELRQIGVRDESRVLGGIAVCGRTYCCHGITDRLKSVSIKMAKEQNLSLNSMKISGPCGRLLCCLSYEFDFYREEKKRFPPEGSRYSWNNETFKVTETNVLKNTVTLLSGDGRMLEVPLASFTYDKENQNWKILQLEGE
ncbi:MAG: hypothetical protein JW760_10945 [Spirochaetales bacterium]|nr:hypothetical protein [Spirochaetales bacterium]